MRFIQTILLTLCSLERILAIAWIEPLPTPRANQQYAGVSPKPTEAPGLYGIPKELLRRQQDVIYPPPANWCGFISSDYSNLLSCSSDYTCVTSRYGVGCCSDGSSCTDIFTSCKDFGDVCSSSCEANDAILKCSDTALRYCGTYRFPGATRLFNCESTTGFAVSVQHMSDYYASAISSTLDDERNFLSSTVKSATASSSRAAYRPSYTYTSDTSSSYSSSSDSGGGLSAGAIRGIAIGISVGVCVIFILLAMFIVKRRRDKRMKRAAQPSLPPAYTPSAPMQQQSPPPSNPAYQRVPQQDQIFPPSQGGYYAPDAVGKADATSVMAQPSLTSSASQPPQQRHSAAPSTFLSPNPSDQGRDSYYRGPVSPTITEVGGSGHPMPGADSIQRPTSTHQGMVSPMTSASPPPPSPMPQYGPQYSHLQQPQQNQGQVHQGYVPPRAGTYEAPLNHANPGPYEMPDQRH